MDLKTFKGKTQEEIANIKNKLFLVDEIKATEEYQELNIEIKKLIKKIGKALKWEKELIEKLIKGDYNED